MTILYEYDPARKKDPSSTFNEERDNCLKYFERWSETDQVEFVENLLARMCHYQHGHINSYLKPMLQRDFISLLPSKLGHILGPKILINKIFSNRKRIGSCGRKYTFIFRRSKFMCGGISL